MSPQEAAAGGPVDPASGRPVEPDAIAALSPSDPLSERFRALVGASIAEFVAARGPELAAIGTELDPVARIIGDLTAGGKRLRPAFCYWGHVAVAGQQPSERAALITAAASLELLHVSALVHDDVMDASDLRRGLPAAHRQFESIHADLGWLGDPATFGRAGAILLGDLLLIWSMQMLHHAGLALEALDRALPIMEAMRTEVTAGQFLDVVAQAQDHLGGEADAGRLEQALDKAGRVVEYKAARYTVRRPLQFGAAVGGASAELQDQLAGFGSPLGRAFQYRDDVLGVFGDSAVTGKPTGDDLREGKRTVLVAQAMAGADPAGRRLLETQLGNPDLDAAGVAELQRVITESGARDAVEQMIQNDHDRALDALADADITDDGRTALTALADAAVRRRF